MNPIRLLKILSRANRLANLMEEGRVSKQLWKSKTFWFNVLTAAADLTGVLPIPPGTLLIISAIINVGLRIVTDQPVTVLPQK